MNKENFIENNQEFKPKGQTANQTSHNEHPQPSASSWQDDGGRNRCEQEGEVGIEDTASVPDAPEEKHSDPEANLSNTYRIKVDDSWTPLSSASRAKLKRLTPIAQNAVQAGTEGIEALLDIKNEELFRETHHDFDAWCLDVLDINTASRLSQIKASIDELAFIRNSVPGYILPQNERGFRALRTVKEKQCKIDVLKLAYTMAGDKRPSGANIEDAITEIFPNAIITRRAKAVKPSRVLKQVEDLCESVRGVNLLEATIGERVELEEKLDTLNQLAEERLAVVPSKVH